MVNTNKGHKGNMGGEALMSYKGPTNSDFTFTLKLIPS